MLRLHLFGPGQAYYAKQPLTGFPNQQHYRLLCYLLLNRGHSHYRERLAAVFWGEYSTGTSRTYLRSALWRLRSALQSADVPVEQYLMVTDDCVSFVTSGQYWLDIEAFESAIAYCQDIRAQALSLEQVAHLEGAADLYVGDLLEGVYEDWCLYDRERLRLLYLNSLGRLLAFHEYNGTYERGLAHGTRILACDPTREGAHRQMMRLYWLMGDRSQALEQYKLCVQILREELSIAPMEMTTQLYRQIVRNQFDPSAWRSQGCELPPDAPRPGRAPQSIVLDALQKLRRLQTITEETAADLYQIEHLISQVLTDK